MYRFLERAKKLENNFQPFCRSNFNTGLSKIEIKQVKNTDIIFLRQKSVWY